MAVDYSVNYRINVDSSGAIPAITSFTNAVNSLTAASKNLDTIKTKWNQFFNATKNNTTTLKVDTSQAISKLDAVIGKLRTINRLSKTATLTMAGGSAGSTASRASVVPVKGGKVKFDNATVNKNMPKNLGYKAIGPTPLGVGGVLPVDFLKGMGIAYGIAGVGNLVGDIVSQATSYDNIMQTAKNILKSHDKQGNFEGRFSSMAQTVRDVGVETKFKATEVAEAAKFLAMAGFNLNDINQSIRPIADIALIGDTDLGTTADIVTNIMTGYGIRADQVRNAADIMTMTFTMSNTTLTEIAEAYKYSATLLSNAGIDFEEATAGLGILGDAGIKGSQAGTTMRTIMGNLVNPTKKQRKQWEALGISPMDANGKVRPLIDIFKDLSNAGLYVDDFFKIFHRTAAQGAAALAQNVDKWNNIIRENFLSQGMSKKLADEKKNTIAGLWAQITSQFTENGMKAFDGIQGPIKDFMNEFLAWLKTDGVVAGFKSFSKDLMDFFRMIKDVTLEFVSIGKSVSGIIKPLIKLQLILMPLLATFKIFKSLFLGGAAIIKYAGKLTFLMGKFVGLTKSVKSLGAAMRLLATSTGGFFVNNFRNGVTGKDTALVAPYQPGVQAAPSKAFQNRGYAGATPPKFNTPVPMLGALGKMGGIGAAATFVGGTVVGAAGGAAIGHYFGGSTGAVIGGIAGMAAAPALLSAGWPGWIALGLIAGGGLVAAWVETEKATKAAQEAMDKYINSTKMLDGVMSGDGLSNTEKWLEIVYNKELSINQIIEKRIELKAKEMGLPTAGTESPEVTTDGKALANSVKNFEATDHWYYSGGMFFDASRRLGKLNVEAYKQHGKLFIQDPSGKNVWQINNPEGGNDEYDALAAITALYEEGVSGSAAKAAKDNYALRLAYLLQSGGTWEDVQAIRDEWSKKYTLPKYNKNDKTHPHHFEYGYDNVKEWSNSQIVSSFPFKWGLYNSMAEIYGPQADIWGVAESYYKQVGEGKVNEETALRFMSLMNNTLDHVIQGYSDKTIDQWARNLGYDVNTGTFVVTNGKEAIKTAKTTKDTLDKLLEIIPRLDPAAQRALQNFFLMASQLNDLASGYIYGIENVGAGKVKEIEAQEGDKRTVNGIEYTYTGNRWRRSDQLWDFGLSNADMSNMMAALNTNKTGGGGGTGAGAGTGTGTSGGSGGSAADYKSNYKSSSAAPKQLIVKIENLMNVESVDLSNPDNAATVSNLKSQLAQALIDVVHDFDNTFHG